MGHLGSTLALVCLVLAVAGSERGRRQAPIGILNPPIPTSVAHYPGTSQQIDQCPRDEVSLPDGSCHRLLTQGPCGATDFVLLDPDTNQGYCAPRLCSPDRVFIFSDQMCHDPRNAQLCPPGRQLYLTGFGTPVCQCPDGTYEGDDDLDDDVCDPLLGQTLTCPPGQVLWFRDFSLPPECLPDPCGGENLNRGPNDLAFVPSADGSCYQLGTMPNVCPAQTWYSLALERLQGVCSSLQDAGYEVFDAATLALFNRVFGPPIPRETSAPLPTATPAQTRPGGSAAQPGPAANTGLNQVTSGFSSGATRQDLPGPTTPGLTGTGLQRPGISTGFSTGTGQPQVGTGTGFTAGTERQPPSTGTGFTTGPGQQRPSTGFTTIPGQQRPSTGFTTGPGQQRPSTGFTTGTGQQRPSTGFTTGTGQQRPSTGFTTGPGQQRPGTSPGFTTGTGQVDPSNLLGFVTSSIQGRPDTTPASVGQLRPTAFSAFPSGQTGVTTGFSQARPGFVGSTDQPKLTSAVFPVPSEGIGSPVSVTTGAVKPTSTGFSVPVTSGIHPGITPSTGFTPATFPIGPVVPRPTSGVQPASNIIPVPPSVGAPLPVFTGHPQATDVAGSPLPFQTTVGSHGVGSRPTRAPATQAVPYSSTTKATSWTPDKPNNIHHSYPDSSGDSSSYDESQDDFNSLEDSATFGYQYEPPNVRLEFPPRSGSHSIRRAKFLTSFSLDAAPQQHLARNISSLAVPSGHNLHGFLTSVRDIVSTYPGSSSFFGHHRSKRTPLPHATPGNVFETRLASCRSGAQRGINAKCRNTILPPRGPASRPIRAAPSVPPSRSCPRGQSFNVRRMCAPSSSAIGSINAFNLG